MKKQSIGTIGYISFALAEKRYGAQIMKTPALGQRCHEARAEIGHAKHTERVKSSGWVLVAAEQYVGRTKHGVVLIDGGQRLREWIVKGDCPFEKLALVTHKVVGATIKEVEDKTAALNREYDSSVALRKPVHYYASAARSAGMTPKSNAYKNGRRSGTYFKRSLGLIARNTDRQLAEAVGDEFMLHLVMDELFAVTENVHLMSRAQARTLFSPGAQAGLFAFLSGRGGIALSVQKILIEGLLLAAGSTSVTKKGSHPASIKFARAFTSVCNEANYQAIRNLKSTDEGLYDTVAEQLKVALTPALKAVLAPKVAKAV